MKRNRLHILGLLGLSLHFAATLSAVQPTEKKSTWLTKGRAIDILKRARNAVTTAVTAQLALAALQYYAPQALPAKQDFNTMTIMFPALGTLMAERPASFLASACTGPFYTAFAVMPTWASLTTIGSLFVASGATAWYANKKESAKSRGQA